MNADELRDTIRTLPRNSVAYLYNYQNKGRDNHTGGMEAQDLAEANMDPQWGWSIALRYQRSDRPLPASLRDPSIRRAYYYLRGMQDQGVASAHAIRYGLRYYTARAALVGFLSARDISIEGIASLLGLEVDVVQLYGDLFFAIRDRIAAHGMTALFPEGRLGAIIEAEKDYHDSERILMRAGRDYGWREVARMTGLAHLEQAGESNERVLEDLDRQVAANARMLARMGHLNRPKSVGIQHGKALQSRKKVEDIRKGLTPDDESGLGSYGMAAPVLEHFRRISDPDIQHRLALERQKQMRQLKETEYGGEVSDHSKTPPVEVKA
jgi:hypothetical protein